MFLVKDTCVFLGLGHELLGLDFFRARTSFFSLRTSVLRVRASFLVRGEVFLA